MLSLVFTSSCSLPPPPSTSPSSLLSHCLPLLLLQSSHRHHSDHWVLVEFTLAVHQAICLGSLNPHPLVHLPCHRGMERLKHFHGKFHVLTIMLHHAMLPKGIVLLLQPQASLLLSSSAIAVAACLSLLLCTPSSPQAADAGYLVT